MPSKTPPQQLNPREQAPILGIMVTDTISGYTGIVRGVKYHNSGCQHVLVQREGVDLVGNPHDALWLDFTGLKGFKALEVNTPTKRPELLGVKVRDTITGYTGIVTAVAILDSYDIRVYIQGTTLTDEGIPSPSYICDLMNVVRLDKKPVKKTKETGAPAFLSRARSLR